MLNESNINNIVARVKSIFFAFIVSTNLLAASVFIVAANLNNNKISSDKQQTTYLREVRCVHLIWHSLMKIYWSEWFSVTK